MTTDGEGEGHYICDVKDRASEYWYRTNDNRNAVPILSENVTQNTSVVLYTKIKTL